MLVAHDRSSLFFFNNPLTTDIYTLSLHDALPICFSASLIAPSSCSSWRKRENSGANFRVCRSDRMIWTSFWTAFAHRSEEHTSELQSLRHLVCRLLLEKKKKRKCNMSYITNYSII